MIKPLFLDLVRLGIGRQVKNTPTTPDWIAITNLAEQQGLLAIVIDGVEILQESSRPPKQLLLQWIGQVMKVETKSAIQWKAASGMASLFHAHHIKTYVLKGAVVAECYPNPAHRASVDMDCYLLPERDTFDAWTLGNGLIKAAGYEVQLDYYKNSTFILPGLMVENHRYFTPFRGNKRLTSLETLLQGMMKEDKGEDRFDGTCLCRPPVMVSALFLIEHAYSHFLHEGLTWRLILDWMMFSRKHEKDIDGPALDALIDKFGFRRFYDSYYKLGRYLLGEIAEEDLNKRDKLMLADVWEELDLHETVRGIRGKLALVGNTWRARWKYRHFSEISMLRALWIQVKGVLFMKNPQLG